ncbi:hypothetical protein KUCAC02_027701, partial [Chaenocephalus aceratus]
YGANLRATRVLTPIFSPCLTAWHTWAVQLQPPLICCCCLDGSSFIATNLGQERMGGCSLRPAQTEAGSSSDRELA